jgi:S1-C subfamily serine protease
VTSASRVIKEFGFQESDIITAINGEPLHDPYQLMFALNNLENPQISIQFERDSAQQERIILLEERAAD